MNHHIDSSKVKHDIMLLSTVKTLKEKSEQKDLEIAQLKEWNTKKDETINAMEQDLGSLKNKLDDVRVQLATQVKNNEEKVVQNNENIGNLQKFADTLSKLHYTLSNKWLRMKIDHGNTLLQENYNNDEDVKKWNHLVKELNKVEDNTCEFLETLKDSINQYSETVYSPEYKERLEMLHSMTPLGTGFPFLRVASSEHFDSICVKSFFDLEDFDREVRRGINERRFCEIQNEQDVFSYYDDDTLNVVLWGLYNVQLLHNSNEEQNIELPNGVAVKVDNLESFTVLGSIVLFKM